MSKRLSDTEFDRLMARARKTNASRDASDRKAGFAAPPDLSAFEQMRTAKLAIECGLKIGDPNAIAEGLAMLEAIEQRFVVLDLRKVPNGS